MADRGLGAWESMVESYKLTEGYRIRLLAVGGLCGLLNLLGLMCLFVGVLVTMPLYSLAVARLYDRVTRGHITDYQRSTSPGEYVIALLSAVLMLLAFAAIVVLILSGDINWREMLPSEFLGSF